MGGSNSCFHSGGTDSDEKTIKGNRLNDYTEISDDFLTSERPAVSENGDAKPDGDTEDLYENSSSIIRASNIQPKEAGDKVLGQTLAEIMKHNVAPATDGKKTKLQPVPPSSKKANEVKPANGSKEASDQAPAFCLGNPSEVGHYQNVLPAGLQKPKPPPKAVKQKPEEEGNVYAQVQKPKPKNGNSQLNYIEVEFLQSPDKENKMQINSKNEQPPIAYTDVIHKDGKIMLVSPSS